MLKVANAASDRSSKGAAIEKIDTKVNFVRKATIKPKTQKGRPISGAAFLILIPLARRH
jgi:hypothetical protein